MQDPSDLVENAQPEENDRSYIADPPVEDDPALDADGESDAGSNSDSDTDTAAPSTVLAEILPGIAVVFGQVPAELKPGLIDFGLMPTADLNQLSAVLGAIGNTATLAGNLGNAFASAQGLYRLGGATQSLLRAGATLAVKDGANLGAVFFQGRIIAQARLIPFGVLDAAPKLASIGPPLAMIALQMQLSEVTGLVRTNIELTGQVLSTIRNEQRAELTGLVATVDRAIEQARKIESVPASLWDTVAGCEAALLKQLDLYRRSVSGHIAQIGSDPRRRREYLQSNGEAIVFDSFALLDSLKAWTGYKALQAGRARAAGGQDVHEARLVDVIAGDTRSEFDAALAASKNLVGVLTRELRIIAELPGRESLAQSLTGNRKDAIAARQASARLLEAIQPLADAIRPPTPALEAPEVVCAPGALDLKPYLRILRWFLEEGETLVVLGVTEQPEAPDPISAILGGAKDMLVAAMDKKAAKTLVAVTDRRILTARTNTFLEQGEISRDVPPDLVRYVRVATTPDKSGRSAIDLITRDENIRWFFHADVDSAQVSALAAELAESMVIPDGEREELRRLRRAVVEAGELSEGAGTELTGPADLAGAP